jgi:hypothetical protein
MGLDQPVQLTAVGHGALQEIGYRRVEAQDFHRAFTLVRRHDAVAEHLQNAAAGALEQAPGESVDMRGSPLRRREQVEGCVQGRWGVLQLHAANAPV